MCYVEKKDVLVNKISVPSAVTLERPHLFKSSKIDLPIVIRVSALDFPDTVDKNITEEVDEINIIFISDLNDITFSQYMTQPKSMLFKRLILSFIEENYGLFDYIWLPKCFGNIYFK